MVMMLSLSVSALFLNVGSGLVEKLGRDPTLTGRTELWGQVLKLTPNPVLGTGFESFWLGERLEKLWSIYWWHPNESHNGYLEVYLNLGWIGVVLLALLLVTGYRSVIRLLSREPEAGRICLAYFFVGVAYNFTEAAIKTTGLVWIAFMLAITFLPQVASIEKESVGTDVALRGGPDSSGVAIPRTSQPLAIGSRKLF